MCALPVFLFVVIFLSKALLVCILLSRRSAERIPASLRLISLLPFHFKCNEFVFHSTYSPRSLILTHECDSWVKIWHIRLTRTNLLLINSHNIQDKFRAYYTECVCVCVCVSTRHWGYVRACVCHALLAHAFCLDHQITPRAFAIVPQNLEYVNSTASLACNGFLACWFCYSTPKLGVCQQYCKLGLQFLLDRLRRG